MNIKKFLLEKSNTKKSTIFIALMFLALICPKAWGYAEKDLPSFSEKPFSSEGTLSSDQPFLFPVGF